MAGTAHFYDFSTAGTANITNHTDGTASTGASWMHAKPSSSIRPTPAMRRSKTRARTANQTANPGRTEFRGNSSAALANIHNRAHLTPGGIAGRTLFYDNSTAADATIHTYEGYSDAGRIEFHNDSTAEHRPLISNVPGIVGSSGNGGHVIFYHFRKATTIPKSF